MGTPDRMRASFYLLFVLAYMFVYIVSVRVFILYSMCGSGRHHQGMDTKKKSKKREKKEEAFYDYDYNVAYLQPATLTGTVVAV